MNGFRKLTAALVLSACVGGAIQVPKMISGGNGAAASTASTSTASHSGVRDADDHIVTKTAIGHDGEKMTAQSGRASRLGGVIPTKTFVSAARVGATRNIGVPASVDLRQYSMPIANQGQVSSCVAWTVDYALLGWYARRDGHTGWPFAPMYTYSQINHGVDKGSQPQDALNVAYTQGTDTRSDYFQGDYDWRSQPTAAERANAVSHKIRGYHTLFSGSTGQGQAGVNALANSLAANTPVAISLPIRSGFQNLRAGQVDTDNTSLIVGYHEILAVGYNQSGLMIQNSWGTGWGDAGFGTIAWNVVGTDVMTAHTIDGLASSTTNNTTTTKPTMGAVEVAVPSGKTVSDTVPVLVKWSANSSNGISRYVIWTSMNGGSWVDTTSRLSAANATSVTLLLTPGTSYRFGVAAIDAAGNRSDYGYSAVFSPKVFDDNAVTTTTGWNRYNWTSAYGGNAITSSTAGAAAQFTFTGRGVALVGPKFSTAGQVRVYVDGTFVQTVDLYAASLTSQVTSFAWYWNANGTHTVKVEVVGTTGRPRVDIDAFAVIG